MPLFGEFLIRDMRSEDIDRVVELEKEIFDSPWNAELFRHELRNFDRTIYLVAEKNGRVQAYMGAQVLDAEIHVTNMAVEPSARRAGLGSALLLECISRSLDRGARWLTLEVRRGNDEALEFYRTFGFEELGLRHGYYTDTGEDAIIMATGDIRSQDFAATIADISSRQDQRLGGGAC